MLETPTAFVPAAGTRVRPAVTDGFCCRISHLRVSVTDRCCFLCSYCVSERPQFLPRKDLLTLEELDRLCSAFVGMGITRLRVTEASRWCARTS